MQLNRKPTRRRAREAKRRYGALQTIYASQGSDLAAGAEGDEQKSAGHGDELERDDICAERRAAVDFGANRGGRGSWSALRRPKSAGEQTVIDAQHFTADFGEENRLRTAHGMGAVRLPATIRGSPTR